MHTVSVDTDILIAGAGPVGLFLANECARRGIRFRIVEANASQSEYSKALAIFPRTLEIFDMAGLADPFLAVANRVTSVALTTHDRTLAHMQFSPDESPYPFVAMVPQNVTEQLLAQELHRKGCTIEYETSFVTAVDHDDYVSVTLSRQGQREDLTARFVVGCDGAHSAVRHVLNLPFEGAEYTDLFLLADVETNEALPSDQLQLCPSESGPLAIFPMNAHRRRIVATVANKDGEAPSLEVVQNLLKERAPSGIQAQSLHWSSYFRIHHRQAAKLRVGNMFIAGDAAHIHSPFGGQGMNTGLQDVWNLVWKLDLFLRGHGNHALLDSYSAERRPVIKQVIETTDFMTKVMSTPNKLAQALRNTVLTMVSRLAPFQHAFVERLSELGIAYQGSPIVDGAGKRHFDDSIRGGKGILSRFILLVDDEAEPSTKDAAKNLATSQEETLDLRFAPQSGLTLIRPDGYVAYSARSSDSVAALRSIRSLLDSQTSPDFESDGGRQLKKQEIA